MKIHVLFSQTPTKNEQGSNWKDFSGFHQHLVVSRRTISMKKRFFVPQENKNKCEQYMDNFSNPGVIASKEKTANLSIPPQISGYFTLSPFVVTSKNSGDRQFLYRSRGTCKTRSPLNTGIFHSDLFQQITSQRYSDRTLKVWKIKYILLMFLLFPQKPITVPWNCCFRVHMVSWIKTLKNLLSLLDSIEIVVSRIKLYRFRNKIWNLLVEKNCSGNFFLLHIWKLSTRCMIDKLNPDIWELYVVKIKL